MPLYLDDMYRNMVTNNSIVRLARTPRYASRCHFLYSRWLHRVIIRRSLKYFRHASDQNRHHHRPRHYGRDSSLKMLD
jgi:hypothetical protein